MSDSGESRKEGLRPDFNRSVVMNFQGAQLTSDAGFLLLREIDQRFGIMDRLGDCLEDSRSPAHMLREFYLKGEEVKRSMEWLIRRIIKAAARVAYLGTA